MADKPILFSGPMVRALLAGTKTQTRRIIKPRGDARVSLFNGEWSDEYVLDPGNASWRARDIRIAVGDRLWVKETHRLRSWDEDGHAWVTYDADGSKSGCLSPADEDFFERLCSKLEKAGVKTGEHGLYVDIPPALLVRPSIFMARWASRLTLKVTDVRVERLRDISEEDARAEGAQFCEPKNALSHGGWSHDEWYVRDTAKESYSDLWDRINGPGSWEANPWVVAYSFEVHRSNIDALGAHP